MLVVTLLTCVFAGQAVHRDDGFIVVLADIQRSLIKSTFEFILETFNLVKYNTPPRKQNQGRRFYCQNMFKTTNCT